MADLLHGYGAQLIFDGIWRGPEYGPEIITIDKVIFYRFHHFMLWDHVPESLGPRGTAGALCVYCNGSFPGHHRKG